MKESGNFDNTREFCKIRELKPRDPNSGPYETDKVFLYLGSFLHRTKSATGDLSDIVNAAGAKFVTVDWPKTEFDEEKVLEQLLDYIRNNKGKEFIISGLSFGEIIARDLFLRLTDEEKKQIRLYISICGVSDRTELNLPKHMDLVKKINKRVLEILAGAIGKIDRGFLGDKTKRLASKKAADRSREVVENVGEHSVNKLVKAASVGLNPGLIGRFFLVLNQKTDNKKQNDIESVILYSDNDPIFTDPKANALRLQKIHTNSKVINLGNAGHAALVERPDRYNEVLQNAINEKWQTSK